jgi:hypothetical protein
MTNTPNEQLRYSRLLYWGSRSGLLISSVAFLAYVFGVLPAHVPLDQLPGLWGMSAHEFNAATHSPIGWQWFAHIHEGEYAGIAGIAWLSSCSLVCLMSIIPIYWERRDRIFVAICLLEIAILVLAASNVLHGGH